MKCTKCKHEKVCQYINSDSGDLRFLLGEECEYYYLLFEDEMTMSTDNQLMLSYSDKLLIR